MSTLRETLKKQLLIDYAKAPKKYWNQNDLELNWNDKEKRYKGKDAAGHEWITALQRTQIPIFGFACPNPMKRNNIEGKCNTVNFVPITEEGLAVKCVVCHKNFTPKFIVPKESRAHGILEKLDK